VLIMVLVRQSGKSATDAIEALGKVLRSHCERAAEGLSIRLLWRCRICFLARWVPNQHYLEAKNTLPERLYNEPADLGSKG